MTQNSGRTIITGIALVALVLLVLIAGVIGFWYFWGGQVQGNGVDSYIIFNFPAQNGNCRYQIHLTDRYWTTHQDYWTTAQGGHYAHDFIKTVYLPEGCWF